MTISKKSVLSVSLFILILWGVVLSTFANPPTSPYGVSQNITDPSCPPGGTNCYVDVVTADNGLTATGGNVSLGGTLTGDTTVDQSGFDFSIMNGDVGYQSSSDILGLGQPGIGMTYQDGNMKSMVGLLGNMVPIMSLQADFGSNHISRVITLGEPNGMEIEISENARKTNFSIDSGSAVLSAIDTNASQNSNIEISYNNGVEFSFDGNSSSYVFPRTGGTAGQVLTTNGNGQLSWETPSGGGGSPAGSDTQIQYNDGGSFGADAGFYKGDETFGLGLLQTQQSTVTFTGSGLDNLIKSGTFSGTYPTTYTVTIDGINKDYIQFPTNTISGSGFQVGETVTSSSGGSATIDAINLNSDNSYENLVLSSVTGTFLQFDVITGSTSSTTATIDSDLGQQDTYSWTDGTNSGSNVICKISGTNIQNGLSANFDTGSGHTLSDEWTWDYTNVQNNILDFSNGTYKFGTDFGNNYFGYEVGNNLFGAGFKGAVNTWTTTGGDFGLSGLTNLGGNFGSHTLLQWSDGSFATSELTRDRAHLGFANSSYGVFELSGGFNNFHLRSSDISGFDNGIALNNGTIQIGNLGGGNNTKITINDIAQTINFNNNYSFPFADGAAGQVLGTDGSGQLGWVTVSGGSVSPISIGTSGNTLYSSGLSGTGQGDTSTGNNIFLGIDAGNSATSASYSNFFGNQAGYGATNASNSNFLGFYAGQYATDASNSNFLGENAGGGATGASYSNFLGSYAGNGATNAYYSNFFGVDAGNGALNANASNFFGKVAGYGATGASNSNFFGVGSGYGATGASNSNFLGESAGSGSANAYNSNFFGQNAGRQSTNASNSTFIGKNAGYNDLVNNTLDTDDFSILIGNNTSTGGFSNSIALGGYATNTATNQFMIGSTTRPINQIVMVASGGTTCATDINGTACSSDERLKTNITDLTTGILDKVVNTKTVTFNWNNNTDTTSHIGFIAQDIQQYFPELVSTGSTGYLSVNYAGMTPVLVQAIREMNLHITELSNMERPNTWRDSLIAWFESTTNGIRSLVVHDKICVDDQCLTKDDIKVLLQMKNGSTGSVPNSPPSDNTPPTPDPLVCTAPQVLNQAGDTCIDPEPTQSEETPPIETPSTEEPTPTE